MEEWRVRYIPATPSQNTLQSQHKHRPKAPSMPLLECIYTYSQSSVDRAGVLTSAHSISYLLSLPSSFASRVRQHVGDTVVEVGSLLARFSEVSSYVSLPPNLPSQASRYRAGVVSTSQHSSPTASTANYSFTQASCIRPQSINPQTGNAKWKMPE